MSEMWDKKLLEAAGSDIELVSSTPADAILNDNVMEVELPSDDDRLRLKDSKGRRARCD